MDVRLIKLFNVALVENEKMSEAEFRKVNEVAARVGYLVHPDVCNKSVLNFLKGIEINPNATFYKEWEDITSKTRLELLFDQLFHYMTTYGTGFALGNGYVPNDGAENVPTLNYEHFKVIMPVTRKELFERCWNMLCSGVALKQDTMKACADFVLEEVSNGVTIDVDAIRNREAQIYICTTLNIWPTNPTALFRMIIFLTTGGTMVINNTATIRSIEYSQTPFNFNKLDANTMARLSSIFLRFKNLFLAFKHNANTDNKSAINKLRKLAVKNHKPFVPGFWQTVFSVEKTMVELEEHIAELTPYKMVSLMQACLERIGNNDNRIYIIRNGKMFFKTDANVKDTDMSYLVKVYDFLHSALVEKVKEHALKEVIVADIETEGAEPTVTTVQRPKVVKVYKGMHVTMPSSEKSFIGNYPFGTSYDLTHDNFVGCYWRNEWGTHDYDLSLVDNKGCKIGWNSWYYNNNQDIIYSGDMTNASPEAAEIIKMKHPKDLYAVIKVNQYSGNSVSKFEMFFGQTKKNDFKERVGYMVDPNDIKFRATIEHENKRELQIGLVGDGKITLMEVHTGNGNVSRANGGEKAFMETMCNKTRYFVDAEKVLRAAGFEVVDETYTGEVDIDMANLDKDTLISLMA